MIASFDRKEQNGVVPPVPKMLVRISIRGQRSNLESNCIGSSGLWSGIGENCANSLDIGGISTDGDGIVEVGNGLKMLSMESIHVVPSLELSKHI